MAKLSRAESVLRNDEAIRNALIDLISESGWDSVTVSGIAKRAGVTVGAIYARAENIAELANDVWLNVISCAIEDLVRTNCLAAKSGDPQTVLAASSAADDENSLVRVALELVVASQFDDELEEVIGADCRRIVADQFELDGATLAERHHSAALFLVNSFLFGRLLARASGATVEPLSLPEARILAGFYGAAPCESRPLELPDLHFVKTLDSEGSAERALFEVFARWGYRKATLARMARATGSTPGAVMAGHASKAQLIGEAARVTAYSTIEVWRPYEKLQATLGAPAVRAHFLFKFLDPVNRRCWKSNLELARLAPAHPELDDYRIPAEALPRTHIAVMMLALFSPDVSSLPFEGCFNVGYTT